MAFVYWERCFWNYLTFQHQILSLRKFISKYNFAISKKVREVNWKRKLICFGYVGVRGGANEFKCFFLIWWYFTKIPKEIHNNVILAELVFKISRKFIFRDWSMTAKHTEHGVSAFLLLEYWTALRSPLLLNSWIVDTLSISRKKTIVSSSEILDW